MTEEKAIRLCLKHRDPSGFEFLVRQFRREAFYHAYALLRNEADAADACQESFTCAFAALPKLRQLDKFYPWFYRILKNRCLNMLARKKTRDTYVAQQRQLSPTEGGAPPSPSSALEAKEEGTRIHALLDSLQQDHREILTLKYIHGFRYDEIVATLGIPRGTVMSRLYAARKAFRAIYIKNQTDDDPAPSIPPQPNKKPRP